MIKNHDSPRISFHYLIKPFYFPGRTQLKSNLITLFKTEAKTITALDYIFCSDPYLLEMNNTFLHHNYYTDIITFNLSEKKAVGITGEIYISIDRVRDNAIQLGQSFSTELRRVVFHGALHLCGYKDKTAKQVSLMRTKEDYYINVF